MAAIGVDRKSYLEVILDGKPLPLEAMRFSGILISQHQLYHLPCGQLVFSDPYRLTNNTYTPADGSELIIRIGPNSERVKTYKFRVFHTTTEQEGSGLKCKISFISNYPSWFLKSGGSSIRGNSRDALLAIADRNGLQFDGVTTSDSQAWLPATESECRFARRIASFGYVDDTSCMMMGVTLEGKLKYVNLNSRNFSSNLPLFAYGAEKGIFCTDWSSRSLSGSNNLLGGYKTAMKQFDPLTALRQSASKVSTKRITSSINVNKAISGKVGDGRTKVMPMNSGNKHSKANEASNQNMRIALFLAQSVSVLTPIQSGVELFEPIQFENYLYDGKTRNTGVDPNTSGPYLVVGKAIYIGADLLYTERLQFIRDGYGADKSKVIS